MQVAVIGEHPYNAECSALGEAAGGVLPAHRHSGSYSVVSGANAEALQLAEPYAASHANHYDGFLGGASAIRAWGAVQDSWCSEQVSS